LLSGKLSSVSEEKPGDSPSATFALQTLVEELFTYVLPDGSPAPSDLQELVQDRVIKAWSEYVAGDRTAARVLLNEAAKLLEHRTLEPAVAELLATLVGDAERLAGRAEFRPHLGNLVRHRCLLRYVDGGLTSELQHVQRSLALPGVVNNLVSSGFEQILERRGRRFGLRKAAWTVPASWLR
jgi:hypothetical protein